MTQRPFRLLAGGLLVIATVAHAQDLGDRVKQFMNNLPAGDSQRSTRQLPESEVAAGLKAALADGASAAVTRLGHTNGFWGDTARRIALPGWMRQGATLLRGAGYGDQLDALHLSMNRAAEQATAEAGPIVRETINDMSVADAYDVLAGSDTAATDYLRAHAGEALAAKFKPIIADTTAQSRAASRYRSLTAKAKPMLAFVPGIDLNLNDYVTQQAMNGLFAVIGQQEKAIRQNPAERGTALLKKVFSAAGR